jgi:hypothetical protein
MTLVERIAKASLDLPSEKAQEAPDFVEILKARSSSENGDLEQRRRKARELLRRKRIDIGGKPMTDREEATNGRLNRFLNRYRGPFGSRFPK